MNLMLYHVKVKRMETHKNVFINSVSYTYYGYGYVMIFKFKEILLPFLTQITRRYLGYTTYGIRAKLKHLGLIGLKTLLHVLL